jgi:hypothetical protein
MPGRSATTRKPGPRSPIVMRPNDRAAVILRYGGGLCGPPPPSSLHRCLCLGRRRLTATAEDGTADCAPSGRAGGRADGACALERHSVQGFRGRRTAMRTATTGWSWCGRINPISPPGSTIFPARGRQVSDGAWADTSFSTSTSRGRECLYPAARQSWTVDHRISGGRHGRVAVRQPPRANVCASR